MNREQKAATIEALAGQISSAEAIFAVDYRGISVPQAAELRAKLREADASFQVVKNSLTERAADQAGLEALKELLQGPTALTFVRGDTALAAKAVADYGRLTQLLPFKGGLMGSEPIDADQIRAISRLPSRDVLYGQLVGIVASPVSGLVRTLNALIGGLAIALSQVQEKKQAGEIPAGEAPPAAAEAAAEEPQGEQPAGEEPAASEPAPQEPASEEPAAEEQPTAEAPPEPEASQEDASEESTQDENQADTAAAEQPSSAAAGGPPAEATKED